MEENVREMTKEEIREKLDLYTKLSRKRALRDEYDDASESAAVALKSLYDALLRVGFTVDQAFTILIETMKNGSMEK
jgi:hypothetical protein